MVGHWLLENFVGWNRLSDASRDLVGYLSGDIPLQCRHAPGPFKFFVFEEVKKVDSGNWWWSKWPGYNWTLKGIQDRNYDRHSIMQYVADCMA